MESIVVKTKKPKEVVDITDLISKELASKSEGPASQQGGLCHLFLVHTTAALTTADLDPGTDLDMLDAFANLVPKFDPTGASGIPYRHPHDPDHVPDHIMSSLIGTSLTLPFRNGKLVLGTWQRVVLVELDGPRDREVVLTLI